MATNSDIARHLGRKPAQISRWVKQGMPTTSLAEAERWVARTIRTRLPSKPAPEAAAGDPATPADASEPVLRRRLLAAEVSIREHKARNSGGVSLPSARVEKGLITGLQLLRASVNGSTSAMYADFAAALGEPGARTVLARVEDWWAGVHDAAADAILLGLQRELPAWGRDFRGRYVKTLRGNFADVPVHGEPRALAEHDDAA